ncbi:radiation sensitive protein rad9 [Neonectria punicea]|uniref:Radiation sensitive protein rad9 n=1 Tax=Neonectria punicea TaxID=979145 RepID=A0ABR1HJP6_9HYPO
MTRSQPLVQADNGDSQDSQAILEAYTAEFGVATLGSSLPKRYNASDAASTSIKQVPSPVPEAVDSWPDVVVRDATLAEARLDARRPAAQVGDPPHWAELDMAGMALTPQQKQYASPEAPAEAGHDDAGDSTNHARDAACSFAVPPEPCEVNVVQRSPPRHAPSRPSPPQDGAPDSLNQSIKLPPIAGIAPPRRMALSQQTPTQVNDDRDYSEYCDLVPSSPVNENTQNASIEPRTLQGHESGAVNFGLSQIGRPSSQVSEDAGFENTRGEWRRPDETPRLNSSHAFTPHRPHGVAFETPALPKNPFAMKTIMAAPLAGSQLFGQVSSAVKKISPTSSRPSPDLFNSISQNLIETSPLKNRANVSSPTDIRTSSPQRLHEIPNTSLQDKDGEPVEAETPLNSRSTGGDLIPESPTSSDQTPRARRPRSPPKSAEKTGPIAHYEPMKKSQERKTQGGTFVSSLLGSDSDSDDAIRRMERRKRVEKRRAQAAEEMGRVSFTPRAARESTEQPSRKKRRVMSSPSANAAGGHAEAELLQAKVEELPTLVDDSQNVVVASNDSLPLASTKATQRDGELEAARIDNDNDILMGLGVEETAVDEERIPATSPAPSLPPTAPQDLPPLPPSEPELPTLLIDDMEPQLDEDVYEEKDEEPSSLPPQRKRSTRTYGRAVRQRRKNPFISSSNSDAVVTDHEPKPQAAPSPLKGVIPSPEPEGVVEEISSTKEEHANGAGKGATRRVIKKSPKKPGPDLPPPMTTRSRRSGIDPVTPLPARAVGNIMPTSSSLSILSSTPVPSAKTTPGTQDSPGSERPESVNLPSPGGGRSLRKRDARGGAKSESPRPTKRAPRLSKRFPRLDSESTDELHHSPSASALEKSMIYAKSSRSFRQSLGPAHKTGRLFESMVFAISFSSHVKPQERTRLEAKIAQAGGMVLPEGFQDLFEQSSIMNTISPVIDEEDGLKLTKSSSESGFTALIADGHSRKAKYMQALALGLPCLAHQWITACLNKGSIVDWEPYVLCSGVSVVLGNAIRSRTLAPYAAADARLADVIDRRPRLLGGQRILVVVDSRKARSEAKEPYIFLATVLGPSISRVFTIQQARDVLLEHEKAGNPFDWLYIDRGTGTVEAVLAPREAAGGKKRRKSAMAQQTMGNIRVLDDELVIQSLILGRMVEEDEMHA